MPYDFKSIESKWQRIWEDKELYKAPAKPRERARKFYCLEMFAYPSGDIHMGHFRNYVIGDVLARYKMMQGYDVFHPFGWDAFGLPAEQAAIQHQVHPKKWTLDNITVSRQTLKKVGLSYDWDKEIITCNPDFYKWNQWIFIKLFERNLAYRAKSLVNWCPSDKTVLANEQVVDGRCWRCGTEVTKRELEQWFLKITAYADRLLAGLDQLPGWPENVKAMQKNWIGRSEGVEINFTLEQGGRLLPVFTTRPDTIFGVTFMSVAPEHPLLKELKLPQNHEKEVQSYIEQSLKKSEIERTAVASEKTGVFTGLLAKNPLSGENVQLWVADYVLAGYGTGIVMGVPAHDRRDFLFAKKYRLPVKVVIQPIGAGLDPSKMADVYTEPGTMVNSGQFDNLPSQVGIDKVISFVEEKKIGKRQIHYKLRDWLVSRQRYWGTPIPMIHCPKCGIVPVLEKDLPIILPENVTDFLPQGRSPLEDIPEFINVNCSKCGGKAKRDPDTMDTFVDSSWYQLRYLDNHNDRRIFDKEKVANWSPVDQYIGGVTHATGHLIYFRFFYKFLADIGALEVRAGHPDEPALRLFNHGMVLDSKEQVMSKSKGNVVPPMDIIAKWGVDVARVAVLFAAPTGKELLWSEESLTGASRFINRVSRLAEPTSNKTVDLNQQLNLADLGKSDADAYRKLNWAIRKVGFEHLIKGPNPSEGIESFELNTGIAALMELLNLLDDLDSKISKIHTRIVANFTQLLAPFAPHIVEEIWENLGYEASIFKSQWPEFDPEAVKTVTVTYAVQINGKLRATVDVPADMLDNGDHERIIGLAKENEKVASYLQGKTIVKTHVVPRKIVSFVVK